ncbi:MAG: hypothetical protein Q4G16_11370, partial [Cruoricaptor ignavus]|nr:hypothetical protein [Cruoricaptor ignavus]
MKQNLLFIFLLIGLFLNAQTSIYFKYDESGNQKYRGTDNTRESIADNPVAKNIFPTSEKLSEEEEQFWKEIRIYPVPVKDILTVDWSENINENIANVSLYEHNSVHWKFQAKNLPNLNRQINIDMSDYYIGVYILRFQLKDGKI